MRLTIIVSTLLALATSGCESPSSGTASSPDPATERGAPEASTRSAEAATPDASEAPLEAAQAASGAAPDSAPVPTTDKGDADAKAAVKGMPGAKPAQPEAAASAAAVASTAGKGMPSALASADKPGGDPVVGAKKTDGAFSAWLQGGRNYEVGKPGSVQAVVIASGGFKCNDAYPFKFKLNAPPAGVSYPSNIARGVQRGKKRTVVTVPFTPSSAGSKRISGTLHFSVCNDDSCLIKKQPMSVTITVADKG